MGKNISKDADKLICVLYKEYLERRKQAGTKDKSRYFGDSNEITQNFFPALHPDDVASTCWELHDCGYLICGLGDDMANDVTLTDTAIVYMENRFKDGLKEVISFLASFIP